MGVRYILSQSLFISALFCSVRWCAAAERVGGGGGSVVHCQSSLSVCQSVSQK